MNKTSSFCYSDNVGRVRAIQAKLMISLIDTACCIPSLTITTAAYVYLLLTTPGSFIVIGYPIYHHLVY